MFSKEYIDHYKENFKLAYPLVIGQAGHMMASIADSIMVGRVGFRDLAAASFANASFVLLFVFGIGIAMGITPLIAKSFGERNIPASRTYFYISFLINFAMGLIITGLLFVEALFFDKMGQQPEVVELARTYFSIITWSMIPYMIFLSFKQLTEALLETLPGMFVSIACNLLNILLNWCFIYGNLGFKPMGLVGAGYATFIARLFMAISMAAYVFLIPRYKPYILLQGLKINVKKVLESLNFGFSIGIQYVLEAGAFILGAIIIGTTGTEQLAAHQIAISLAAFTYLGATGISGAATARLGNLLGERKFNSLRKAGYASIVMGFVYMGICAALFLGLNRILPSLFVKDEAVVGLASKLLIIAAFFQIFDGVQVVALGALRGIQDVRIPTWIALVSYWVVALPISYYFGIIKNLNATGVWYGYLAGLITAAAALTFRYVEITSKLGKRFA